MTKHGYMPQVLVALIVWLRNFAEKIGIHVATGSKPFALPPP
jgi:hypothetical protein